MATPEINENCHFVQNDAHRCKIKLEKFHFDILCCFGVIRESLPGGAESAPQGEIGLNFECEPIQIYRNIRDTIESCT